jgi:hypothetical protein
MSFTIAPAGAAASPRPREPWVARRDGANARDAERRRPPYPSLPFGSSNPYSLAAFSPST